MKDKPAIMNIGNMMLWTERAKYRVTSFLLTAKEIAEDIRKEARLKKHFCKSCFYMDRVAGSATTERECMSCNVKEMYGSTSTDALCMDCAKHHYLCKHCGGDLDMRPRRRVWPKKLKGELND